MRKSQGQENYCLSPSSIVELFISENWDFLWFFFWLLQEYLSKNLCASFLRTVLPCWTIKQTDTSFVNSTTLFACKNSTVFDTQDINHTIDSCLHNWRKLGEYPQGNLLSLDICFYDTEYDSCQKIFPWNLYCLSNL